MSEPMTPYRYEVLRVLVAIGINSGGVQEFYAKAMLEALDEIERLKTEVAAEREDREAEAIAMAERDES